MGRVWAHFAKKSLGDSVDITLFDCSGRLNPDQFKGIRVQKFLNLYAATKSDIFLKHIAKHRDIGWICDDDVFLLSDRIPEIIQSEIAKPNTACFSFRPRTWWHYEIDGKSYDPCSSYCTVINRRIVVEKERLSLAPCNGNNHPSHIGKPPKRYDTFDKANEVLLEKGYRCGIASEEVQEECLAAFSGLSGAVMLLYHFSSPDEVLNYFETPPSERWSGNMLFGILSSMKAICVIQDLHTELFGAPYPLPALPKKEELQAILEKNRSQLREDHDVGWIERIEKKLTANL